VWDGVGGNGLYLHRYNRHTTIAENEFAHTGDSAIAASGYANFTDATLGDFPYENHITGNHFHDIGVYGKQVSAFFQTLACRNTISGNVMYNGPRAAINFNEGFCGGNLIEKNLIFNMVRETNDHGAFNVS
jgi:hypothetical protein